LQEESRISTLMSASFGVSSNHALMPWAS